MPSPFPGMDPYLERPAYWRMIHIQLIAELARKLNPILRPKYWVATVERYLEIQNVENGEVITTIEVLLPDNKIPEEGREKYLNKRAKLLGGRSNLVEIDLLRDGASMPMSIPAEGSTHYRIFVSRTHQRPLVDVSEFGVREPIPPLSVPLQNTEIEPVVELNEIIHKIYDLLNFSLVIDYGEDPVPSFHGSDNEWLKKLLTRYR